jgi:aryl-alcohol dehydrogenase-like predicted oxidoreductase
LSERRLGKFLRDKPRGAFTVSTEVGRLLVPDVEGASHMDSEGFAVPAAFRRGGTSPHPACAHRSRTAWTASGWITSTGS